MSDLRDLFAEVLIAHPCGLMPVDRSSTTWPWEVADALIQAWIDRNAENWRNNPASRPMQ